MKLRLNTILAASAVVFGLFAGASASSAETWRLSSMMPETSFEGQAFTRFAQLAEEYTEGRVKVRVYPNEQLGKIDVVMDQLRDGTIHLAPTQISYLNQWEPAFAYSSAPFLFSDYEQWSRFMASDMVKGWLANVEEKAGITVLGDLAALRRGSFRVIVSKNPIASWDDLKGLKMRQYQDDLVVSTWSHLGTEPRVIPWTDIYDAFSRGIVEAATSPAELVEPNRFYEVAPHITRTDEFPQSVSFMMNKRAFDALSPADQEALARAQLDAAAYGVELLNEQARKWEARMAELNVKLNLTMDIDDIVARVRPFYEERAKAGKLPEGFLDAVEAAKAN